MNKKNFILTSFSQALFLNGRLCSKPVFEELVKSSIQNRVVLKNKEIIFTIGRNYGKWGVEFGSSAPIDFDNFYCYLAKEIGSEKVKMEQDEFYARH